MEKGKMGYGIHSIDSNILITADNKPEALKMLLSSVQENGWVTQLAYSNNLKRHYHSLEDALEDLRWEATVNEITGDIVKLAFIGENAGDDLTLFQRMAPYVKADSYLEMAGEDGEKWRWVFDGTTCHEVTPQVVWD